MNAYVDNRSSIIWTKEEAAYIANIIRYDDLGVRPRSVSTPASSLDAITLAPRSPTKLPSLANAALADIQHAANTVPDAPPAHRLLVLGGPGSGKTLIITQFCEGRPPTDGEVHDRSSGGREHEHEHTGSMLARAQRRRHAVQAFEIASEDVMAQADNMGRLMALSHAAVVVYDAGSRASFDHACELRDRFRAAAAARDELYGFALVGNRHQGRAVAVSRAEGARAAELWGGPLGAVFAEVCAASGDGIEKLFADLSAHVLGLCSLRQQGSGGNLKTVAEQCQEDDDTMAPPQRRRRTASTLIRAMHAKRGKTEEEEEEEEEEDDPKTQVGADTARKRGGLWRRISSSFLGFRHSKALS